MAPRSTNAGQPGFLGGDDPELASIAQDEESFAELDRLRAEAGPDSAWQVAVFRKTADGLKYAYCRRLPLSGFDLDKLPQVFGGGVFQLRVINPHGKIQKVISITFDPNVWPLTPVSSSAPGGAPAAAPAAPAADTSSMLIAMQRQLDEDRRGREHFLETLVTAMLTKGQVSTPTMTDLVDAQLKLRELSTPQGKTDGDLVLQSVRLALEAGGHLRSEGEGGGDTDIFTKVIDKVAIPLVDAIKSHRAAAPAPAAISARATGPRPVPGPAGAGTLPPELEPYAFLRQYSPHLLGWARSGFDPTRVSAVIYNLVPDEFFPVLESFLNRSAPERFSILVQLDPRLQPYQTYLDAVMTALSEEMNLDAAEPGDGEPGGSPSPAQAR